MDFGFVLGPLEFNLGGWARSARAVLQLCNTRCCVCGKKTTQDIVVIKIQHTISGSESWNVTQDVVMQFRNVVNISLVDNLNNYGKLYELSCKQFNLPL